MPTVVDPRCGRKIRALRKAAGMSLRDLAGEADLDYTYLSKIERGKSPSPSTEALIRIADALDADADRLLALAGKIAPDVEQMLIEHPDLMGIVREKAKAVPA